MKKWVSSTDFESVKAEKKEIEVVKVVQVVSPEQTPKPQIVVKQIKEALEDKGYEIVNYKNW